MRKNDSRKRIKIRKNTFLENIYKTRNISIFLYLYLTIKSMKIAFAGKGGAGKTTLASLLIQKLAEKHSVLALDLDSNVNLAHALGFAGKMPYF